MTLLDIFLFAVLGVLVIQSSDGIDENPVIKSNADQQNYDFKSNSVDVDKQDVIAEYLLQDLKTSPLKFLDQNSLRIRRSHSPKLNRNTDKSRKRNRKQKDQRVETNGKVKSSSGTKNERIKQNRKYPKQKPSSNDAKTNDSFELNNSTKTQMKRGRNYDGDIAMWSKCGEQVNLNDGDWTYFYSDETQKAANCQIKIKAPKKSKVLIKCHYVNMFKKGCAHEKLSVSGGFKKKTICKTTKLSLKTTGKKTITFHHTRKAKVLSGGFLCEISTTKIKKPAKCKKTVKMSAGDTMIIASDGKLKKRSCEVKIQNDQSLLVIECPKMGLCNDGCNCESLSITDSARQICGTDDVYMETTSSMVSFMHKRSKIPKKKYSAGFMCIVRAEEYFMETTTGYPMFSSSTEYYSPTYVTDPTPPTQPPTAPPYTSPPTTSPNQPSTTPPSQGPTSQLPCDCGDSPNIAAARIVNGEEATPHEYPWMVALSVDINVGRYFFACGGALISDLWVVTASHCLEPLFDREIINVRVQIGSHDKSIAEAGSVVMDVPFSNTIMHENYNTNTLNNDIALIKLTSPVTFSSTIKPLCLATSEQTVESGKVISTGWGNLASEDNTEVKQLREVELDLITSSNCASQYSSYNIQITSNMICTHTPNKDACQGDSGGPLIMKRADNRWMLVGVVSFGIGCGTLPGVFTRTAMLNAWITSKTTNTLCPQT